MNIALILSGGIGTRVRSEMPKQYITVCGRPVIGYCLDVFLRHPDIDAVQVVADDRWRELILTYIDKTGRSSNRQGERKETVPQQI